MHIAQSTNLLTREGETDGLCDKRDLLPSIQPTLLHCPFKGCNRKEAFTTRSNLVRHFQARM